MPRTQNISNSEIYESLDHSQRTRGKGFRSWFGEATGRWLLIAASIMTLISLLSSLVPSDYRFPGAQRARSHSFQGSNFKFDSTHLDFQALGVHFRNEKLLGFCEKVMKKGGPLPKSTGHAVKEATTLPELVSSLPKDSVCIAAVSAKKIAQLMENVPSPPNPKFYGTLTYKFLGKDQSKQSTEEFQRVIGRISLNPIFLTVFRNVYVNSLGHIINEAVYFSPAHSCGREMREWPTEDATEVLEKVFVMKQGQGVSFYHALIEDAVRLAPYIDELLVKPYIKIAIRENELRRELLEILGFSANRIIEGVPIHAKMVFFPEPAICGDSDPLHLRILVQHLIKSLGLENIPRLPKQLVIIKRQKTRFIPNFDELLEMIKSNHPEYTVSIFDEESRLPVADALRLFYHASIIVGPHGAGLANMIMAWPGSQIVEFQPEGKVNTWIPCYQRLAASMGFGYHMTICENGDFFGPISVNIETATKMLRSATQALKIMET